MPDNKSTQVFYRKYRPHEFKDVIGQEHVITVLKNAVKENRLAHAYLFSGPRGTGKTTIARILAKEAGSFEEDIIEIDAASQRGIDEARALREAVHILPLRSKYKVYIIDEVHMLTKEAFNALLKTLEEPPQHAIFILATTELAKVPDTVASRTQKFEFSKIGIADIIRELGIITKAENIKAEESALKLVAFFAEGSLRDAENILFQAASSGGSSISENDVRLILGAPMSENVNKLISGAFGKNVSEVLSSLDEILEDGVDSALVVRLLMRSIRAIYFLSLDPKTENLLKHEFSDEEITSLKKFAASSKTAEYALRQIMAASQTKTDDYTSAIPLELALVKIATSTN